MAIASRLIEPEGGCCTCLCQLVCKNNPRIEKSAGGWSNAFRDDWIINYFTGPLAPSGFGVTMALKLSFICLGHVLEVTVTILFCMPGFPPESNSTFTKPAPPTGMGSFVQS